MKIIKNIGIENPTQGDLGTRPHFLRLGQVQLLRLCTSSIINVIKVINVINIAYVLNLINVIYVINSIKLINVINVLNVTNIINATLS